MLRQPAWQRIILLIVLGYEGLGGLSGGGLLVAAPDGHLMNMPVGAMHGFFPSFLIPGLILIAMGLLNLAAFAAVWRRSRFAWLLAGLALGGFTIWFMTEIAVLQLVSWIHALWGLPVLVGGFMALPLIPAVVSGATAEQAFIKRHPVLTYYFLTFVLSWGGFLIVVGCGPGGFAATPEQLQAQVPYLVPAMLLGPGVVGILLTGLVDGRAGLRAYRSRLLTWRVGARWYAAALLTAPLVFAAVYLPLSLISSAFLPRIVTAGDKPSVLLMGLAVGLGAGIFEELGWTGFAVPRMRLRYGVLMTGLIVGVLWGTWHVLQGYWASGVTSGQLALAVWLAETIVGTLVGQLVAYRVLMVWVYEHTGSLLVAMLMHASLAAFTFIFFDPAAGPANVVSGYASTAVLWAIVAVVAVTSGRPVSRQPLQEAQPALQPGRKRAA